jgi:uncharacterized protein (TIRG00374 family)
MGLAAFVLAAARWRLLLSMLGLPLAPLRAFALYLIGHFFNAFLLGTTGGDVVKALWVTRELPQRKVEAAASVVIERVLGLGVLLVLALVGMVVRWRQFCEATGSWAPVFVLAAAVPLLAGSLLLAVLDAHTQGGRWVLARTVRLRARFGWLERLRMAAFTIMQPSWGLAGALCYSVLCHAVSILSWAVFGRALGLAASPGDYVMFVPIVLAVQSVPITPGGVGVREATTMALFRRVGIEPDAALALSLVNFAAALFWSVVGGAIFAVYRSRPQHAAVAHGA